MTKARSIEEIKNELIKTGFPLELHVRCKLNEQNWNVGPNQYFKNIEKENSFLEIDIVASKDYDIIVKKTKEQRMVYLALIIECKKSYEKPWVFFVDDNTKYPPCLITTTNFKIKPNYLPEDKLLYRSIENFIDYSKLHMFQSKTSATTYNIVNASKEENKQIFKAIETVFRAIKQWKIVNDVASKEEGARPGILVFYPVIILDGEMYEAKLKANDDLDLKRIEYISLSWKPSDEVIDLMHIDVVRKNYLEKYLKSVEKDFEYYKDLVTNIDIRKIDEKYDSKNKKESLMKIIKNPKLMEKFGIGIGGNMWRKSKK